METRNFQSITEIMLSLLHIKSRHYKFYRVHVELFPLSSTGLRELLDVYFYYSPVGPNAPKRGPTLRAMFHQVSDDVTINDLRTVILVNQI